MSTLVNGQLVSCVDISDRGLQYGDGLFETIGVENGAPEFWSRHMARLQNGLQRLQFPDVDEGALAADACQLTANAERGVIKIIITRGSGERGYRIPRNLSPKRIVQFFPRQDEPSGLQEKGGRIRFCTTSLGHNRQLAGIKHLNRLEQVLARNEWDDSAIAEGLMCDDQGNVVEGTMSNLLLVIDDALHTPKLDRCGVRGVIRDVIMELARVSGINVVEGCYGREQVTAATEIMMCNSLTGLWPVNKLDALDFDAWPLCRRLQQAFLIKRKEQQGWPQ